MGKFSSIWPRTGLPTQHRLSIFNLHITEWAAALGCHLMLLPEESVSRLSPSIGAATPAVVLQHPNYKSSCPSMHWLGNDSSDNISTPQCSRSLLWQAEPALPRNCTWITAEVNQLTPLPHSHVHFNPRDDNWGILTLQPLASLLLRSWRKPFDTTCNYEKDSVRKWTKEWWGVLGVLQHYFHPVVNIPQQLGIKLRMNIILSGSLPRRST